ncbi:hypothetical protein MJ584_20090 [Klebsiella pneumoniae]|nr:hypothetical protein MJ584_20090 [Klebsiella pneumoniae]
MKSASTLTIFVPPARGEQAMSVVLRGIITRKRAVAELLGFTITEDDDAAPAWAWRRTATKRKASGSGNHLAQLPEASLPKAWWRS